MELCKVVDTYFLEHRSKVLDIAAFLDRVDRCIPEEKKHDAVKDFRITALRACIKELLSEEPNRAERILQILSDQSTDPIEFAGTKGASGTPVPSE